MTFNELVLRNLRYFGEPDFVLDAGFESIEFMKDFLLSKYEMEAKRKLPGNCEDLFARLVAIKLILDKRASDIYTETGGAGSTGAVKSITVGDTRTEFATSSDAGHEGGSMVLDQNVNIAKEFESTWRTLIATTRRLF